MAGGGGSSLEETPAFAAATVCFVLVFASVLIEHIIHLIGKWLQNRNRIKLYESLQKIKSELMLVGFISLLLTASQGWISKICINKDVAKSWLPCKKDEITIDSVCKKKEKGQFISQEALHELHVFIFILACAHVINCFLTVILGKAKMKRWRKWEEETKTEEYQSTHNPKIVRLTRQTTFVRRHSSFWTTNPILFPVTCFFGQFFPSVRRVDYLTLRHGFIKAHIALENQGDFNFHDYMDKSLEEDFKVVVGISPLIWLAAVISLLLTKYQFHHSLWLPAVPLIVLLVVGTKLQLIIGKMALKIQETNNDIVQGDPVVQLRDELFWFNSPRFLLYLINYVLFQNAVQIAFYQYTWWKFGTRSCFHREKEDSIIVMCMGAIVLFLCSYVTLPLYALVTLMGSTLKPITESIHRPDRVHLETPEPVVQSTPFISDDGQALNDDINDSHTVAILKHFEQFPSPEIVDSKDLFARRSNSYS